MKKLLLLLPLLLLLTFTSCNKDKDIPESIKFSIPNRLPVLKVTINGVQGRLLLDTGAGLSMIDSSVCKKYGFDVYALEDMVVNGIGGSQVLYHTKGVEVYYDEQPMYIRFKSANLSAIRKQLGVVGIVGTDYLRQHKMIIDYKNNVLRKSSILD
jgi:hypothetical protein